jgi:menaquinone-dependent protoporphyrinogen IX oxidase
MQINNIFFQTRVHSGKTRKETHFFMCRKCDTMLEKKPNAVFGIRIEAA